jgi:hypothetical protein
VTALYRFIKRRAKTMQEINVINLLTAIEQAQKNTNKDGTVREIKLNDYAENKNGGRG